jgi:hypothetical protein
MSQHGAVSLVELIETRRIIPEYGGEKSGLDPFLERGYGWRRRPGWRASPPPKSRAAPDGYTLMLAFRCP